MALSQAGLTQRDTWLHLDEMRFGLWGQTRRRWGLRGVKLIQKVQIVFAWRYLVLAVNSLTAELRWGWLERVRHQDLKPLLERWSPRAVVWDRAPAHTARHVAPSGVQCLFLPPYAPELDPAERIFEEIRREIEGEVYPSLRAKQDAIEHFLRHLAADRQRVKALIGWNWIHDAHQVLPEEPNIRPL
jgi:transposase